MTSYINAATLMETVKLVVPTHTILYLPIYAIRPELERRGIDLVISTVIGGDLGTLMAVDDGRYDVCVCDPHFAAPSDGAVVGERRALKLTIVGSLVETVALWTVRKPNCQTYGRVATHPRDTTAYQILDKLRMILINGGGISGLIPEPFGDEWITLDKGDADSVVTSDVLQASIRLKGKLCSDDCLGAHSPFNIKKPFLFSALVVSASRPHHRALKEVLRVLQRWLVTFHRAGIPELEKISPELVKRFTSLAKLDEVPEDIARNVISQLRACRIIATDLFVEPLAWVERCNFAPKPTRDAGAKN